MILTKEINVYSKIIPISDLSIKSHKRILVKCSVCETQKEIKYNDYNKITKNNTAPYFCCGCKIIKINKTKLEKYGEELKEVVNKCKNTMMEKYGVDNPSKLEFVKNKKRQTTLKNYGVDIPAKSDLIICKMKKTCLEKYGSELYMTSLDFKEKSAITIRNKYGDVENVFQSEIIKDKIKNTLIEKYGSDHPMRIEEFFYKQKVSAFEMKEYDGILYQGTYELDFIKFTKSMGIEIKKGPSIDYEMGVYHPDFFILDKNLIIEIKSSYTFEKEYDKNILKQKSCLEKGYNFIFIIDKNYTEFLSIIN